MLSGDWGRVTTQIQQLATSGDLPPVILEYRIHREDNNTVRYLKTTIQCLHESTGQSPVYSGIVQDITNVQQPDRDGRSAYEALLAAANEAVFVIEDGVVIECNDVVCEMFRCEREEIIGLSPADFSPPRQADDTDSYIRARHIINDALKGNPWRFEWLHRRLDGDVFETEVSLSLMKMSGPDRLISILHDITERKEAERSLLERLNTLTSPEEDVKDLSLEDLFDVKELQRMQDSFANATGVASIITHPDGRPITQPTNFCRLCNDIIRKTEKGFCNCMKSDAILGSPNPSGPTIQVCHSGGLWDGGASITVGNHHIANWLVGQVRNEEQNDEEMLKYAREIGADEGEYRNALAEVPTMSSERFQQICDALFLFANQMSSIAYSNLQQGRWAATQTEAAEVIRRSEERYRDLVENANEGIVVIQDMRFRFTNPKACELTGVPRKQLEGMQFLDIVHPDDRPIVAGIHQNRITGKGAPGSHQLKMVNPDGQIRWINANVVVISWDSRPATLAFLTDITDLREAQKSIEDAEKRLREIVDNMPVMLEAFNEEKHIILWNRECERVTGYTKAEIVNNPRGMEILYPDAAFLKREMEEWQRRGNDYRDWEWELTCKDGTKRTIAWSNVSEETEIPGLPIWEIGVDVTERRAAETALRESEAMLQSILRSAPVGLAVVSNRAHQWTNERFTEITGYTSEEIVQRDTRMFYLTQEEYERVGRVLYQQIERQGTGTVITQWKKSDGSVIDVLLSGAQIDLQGSDNAVTGAVLDISDRVKAERAVRENEEKYRALVENNTDLIVRYDTQGRHLFGNRAVVDAFGHPPEVFIGKTHSELEYPEKLCHYWKRGIDSVIESGREFEGEFEYASRVFNWRLYPEYNESGNVSSVLSVSRDITEYRRAEQNYRNLFEKMLDGFAASEIICDESGVPVDYRFLAVNPAFERLTGLDSNSVIGKTVMETLPGTEQFWIDTYGHIALTGEPLQFEHFSGAIGKHFNVSAYRPAPNQFACIFMDITDRKKAEDERERLTTAVEQAAECIIIVGPDGGIRYVNPSFATITGYTREEIIGKPIESIRGHRDEVFYESVKRTITSEAVWQGRLSRMRKNGEEFLVEATISPVRDAENNILEYVFVERDVTRENELESRLRQAQKLEAIGTLAAGIAHDFNNILSAILGYTELAMMGIPSEERPYNMLEQVRKAADRASQLVSQILTFSRQTEQERKPIWMQPIIKEALKLLRASLPATIYIAQDIPEECSPVLADSTQIHQIVMNLCTNAYQAMIEHGGTLSVRLREKTIEYPDIPDLEPGTYISLVVTDTGHGMEEGILNRIFEPYFTTKDVGVGTGLGLATVHGIVRSHDGEITASSVVGEGSTFEVLLPVCDMDKWIDQKPSVDKPKTGTERILLVDDEESIAEMWSSGLKDFGYTTTKCSRGRNAYNIISNAPDNFDIIVTDHTMPDITGVELCIQLRQIGVKLPVILCTGFSEPRMEEQAYATGIAEIVLKPASALSIALAVRRVLDETT